MGILSPEGATAVAGGAQAVGSFFGQLAANKTNLKLARQARAYDLKMWNMQNEYNSPQNQMARLQEAGLNPNLAYGSGSVSGNVTSSPPKSPVPHVENVMSNVNILPMVLDALSAYNSTRIADANVRQIDANTRLAEEKIKSEQERAPWIKSQNIYTQTKQEGEMMVNSGERYMNWQTARQKKQLELDNLELLKTLRQQQSQLNPLTLEYKALENKIKTIEANKVENLSPYGVGMNDNVFLRVLLSIFGDYIKKNQ